MNRRSEILIGAVALVALPALGSRGVRHSSCTGGNCCMPLPGVSALEKTYWPRAWATNQTVGPAAEQVLTNAEQ